jgi:AcrR family transcriptional regulator
MAAPKLRPPAGPKAAPLKQPVSVVAGPIRSAPTRRARRDRGADTRNQLIEAGLDVFGRLGFEGASTREIARAAGANLAAIVYHFGGKEALHIAVAEHVAAGMAARIGTTITAINNPASTADAGAARDALRRLVGTLVDVLLGTAEAERWARFIAREQMQPTAAFDVIYRVMSGAAEVATRLAAVALGRPADAEVRLRVLTIMGQVLVFRVAHALVLRRMQWREIGDAERSAIKAIVLGQMDAVLATGRKSGDDG